MPEPRKVWLNREKVYADLISEGVYASKVRYVYGGILYDVLIENDEFEFLDEENDYDLGGEE